MDIQNIQNLLQDSKDHLFVTNNPYLNKILKKFIFFVITKDCENSILSFQQKNKYNIIIVDECNQLQENHQFVNFFIICFDYTLILIPTSEIQILFSYFSQNNESIIYCLSKNAKAKMEQSEEASNQKIHFNFYEKNDQVFNEKEIPSFLTKFKLEISVGIQENKRTLQFLWEIVKRSISGFLIKTGYFNSKYDRVIHFEKYLSHEIEDRKINKDEYVELLLLNQGSSSSIYLIYLIEKEEICVMKTFLKNQEETKLFEREHENYLNISHPLFPRYFETTEFLSLKCLIIEYIEGKTLNEIDFSEVSEKETMKIIFEIMIALAYLHCNGYILRDLKPNNIIIDQNYRAYLIDFDRMIKKSSKHINEVKTKDFFYEYMAPEILNGQFFSYAADIYSLGKVIFFILSKKCNSIHLNKFLKLLDNCICSNSDKRPNISELIDVFYDDFLIVVFGTNTIKTPLRYNNDIFTFYLFLICEYQDQNALFKLESYYENGAIFNKYNNGTICIFTDHFMRSDSSQSLISCVTSIIRNNLVIYKNIVNCIFYLNLLADNNNSDALYQLGLMYCENEDIERDINKSIYYFTRYVNQDNVEVNPRAQLFLGMIYYSGEFIKPDIEKAVYYLTLSANKNDNIAQYYLGLIYYEGEYFKQDIEKAFYYFKLSANQNNAAAQFKLGMIYYNGNYVLQDIKKAITYLTLASNLNHPIAQYNLGLIYNSGIYVPRNMDKAIHLLTMSANQNIVLSQYQLGAIYYNTRDINKAIHYFSLSADQNYGKSQLALGIIYYNGKYIDRDINKSIHYFTLAAKQDIVESQYNLGLIFSDGKFIPRDIRKAVYYYKLAADQNHQQAQLNLGIIYYKGINNQPDIEKAIYYLKLAADQNNSDAQFNLGVIYYKHYSLPKNINKVLHYLTLAANLNNSDAQFSLAKIYYKGKYVKKDTNKAIHYLTLSSNQKNLSAMLLLGSLFYKEGNIKKGIYYITLASNYGQILAHFFVGFFNHQGLYIPQDIDKAIHYYKEASSFNDQYAKNNLGIIFKNGFKDKISKKLGLAIEYFKEAINQKNDIVSMYNLAHLYFYEDPIDNSIDASIDLLIKSIEHGFVQSNVLLSLALCKKHKFNLNNLYDDIINKAENNADLVFNILETIRHLSLDNKYCFQQEYEKNRSIDFLYSDYNEYFQTKKLNNMDNNKQNDKTKLKDISEQFYLGFDIEL